MAASRLRTAATLVLILLLLGAASLFRVAVVRGDSMLPSFQNGQFVLVSRLPGLGGPLKRGDVVLARSGGDVLIKRVHKLPGETLNAWEARHFSRVADYFELTGDRRQPLRVPQGYLVLLGDNPEMSDDSRAFGPVRVSAIIGRVLGASAEP